MYIAPRHPMRLITTAGIACALAVSAAAVQAQSVGNGSAAASVGRPAIAGAQGGLGAQAGLPQGGLATQGNDAAQVRVPIRRAGQQPGDFPQGQVAGTPGSASLAAKAQGDTGSDADTTPKQKRDTARRVTRTAKGAVPAVR